MNILLIDDSPDILELMRLLFESDGHSVSMASSGEHALALLERGARPDLIFCDYEMEGMSGPEFIARTSIPCVLLTGREASTIAPCGAREVLTKPVGIERLLRAVGRVQ